MSKLKAALITAILGSSTAAMASPSVSFSADAQFSWGTSGPVIRDHGDRYTPAAYQPARPSTSWISLAQPLHLENGRDMLMLNRLGSYTQLRLQATSGLSYIHKVKVRFRDGSVQIVNFNQWLSNRNPMLQVDLRDNRGIESITVMGTASSYNAGYQVFAQGNTTIQLPQRPSAPTYQWMGHDYGQYEQPVMPSAPQAPVQLASELTFNGTMGFRQFPVQTPAGSRFSTLRLEGHGGPLALSRVIVTFSDGTSQQINNINRTLTPGEVVDLRLKGAGQITQLVVYTNDNLIPVNSITGSFMISAF